MAYRTLDHIDGTLGAPILRRTFIASLAAPLASPAAVAPDDDGMLIIDGKRQFVLGLYDLPKVSESWKEAREAGFDVIHVSASKQDFDHAREAGLRTWVSVGSIADKNRGADEKRIRGIVKQFRDDPALLFWETEDEPAYLWKSPAPRVSPRQIVDTHDFVKALDPAHPLYLNHAPANLESTLRKYNSGAEIIATDIYPVIPHGIREEYALWPDGQHGDLLNTTISQVGPYTDKMRRVAGPSRAVFMVLQAFAWEDLRREGRDPQMVLYPDGAQMRSMAYQSIIHGANGLLFWGLASAPPTAIVWNELRAAAGELARLAPDFAAKPVRLRLRIEYRDTGHSLDRGIEWTARPSGKGVLLLCTNADRNPVDASFEFGEGFRRCQGLAKDQEIRFERGIMEDRFAPFEAKVYRLS
jgi:hypothetical protein